MFDSPLMCITQAVSETLSRGDFDALKKVIEQAKLAHAQISKDAVDSLVSDIRRALEESYPWVKSELPSLHDALFNEKAMLIARAIRNSKLPDFHLDANIVMDGRTGSIEFQQRKKCSG